jgi:hypothetical protein
VARRPSGLAYDSTIPGGSGDAYDVDDEDFMDDAERAELIRHFKPAGRQRFSSAQEQHAYLRLVRELQRPQYRPWTAGEVVALGLVTAAIGAFLGWLWRKHRESKTKTHVGLDLLGARK